MRIPRLKTVWLGFGATYFNFGVLLVRHHPAVRVGLFGAEFVFCAWAVYSYINVSPEEKAKRELETRRNRIAELEKELEIEPMNLHELDDILLDEMKHRKEKES